MIRKGPGPSRLITLAEAAKVLGISYERMRVFVSEGRIPVIEIPGIGRVIRREDLERFIKTPRPTGHPPAHQRRSRRTRLAPGSIVELLASVERRTGSLPTISAYRSLIKVGLLPRRRDFPRGEEGRRLCLAHQYRRLITITRFQKHSVRTYRDLLIALKLFGYRVAFHALTRAMLSYLYAYRRARALSTDDDLEQFIVNESFEERSPRLPQRMKRQEREAAYRALLRIGLGRAFTAQEMTTALEAVGLPKELLPNCDTSGESPGLTWSNVLKGIQTIDEEIDRLVDNTIIGPQQKGQRQVILCRPFAPPEELDRAWNAARPLLKHLIPSLLRRLYGISPQAHISYVNATIVRVVASCLVQLYEHGDAAFSPFRGDLSPFNAIWQEAWVRLMVTPPPEPMASLVRQVLVSHPKTDHEYRQVVEKFGEIVRSTFLADGDRRVMDAMMATLSRPSRKGFKKMLAALEVWRAEMNRPRDREVRAE